MKRDSKPQGEPAPRATRPRADVFIGPIVSIGMKLQYLLLIASPKARRHSAKRAGGPVETPRASFPM